MDARKLAQLKDIIDNFLLQGDDSAWPVQISGTRRDRNGDLLVDLVGDPGTEVTSVRITVRQNG